SLERRGDPACGGGRSVRSAILSGQSRQAQSFPDGPNPVACQSRQVFEPASDRTVALFRRMKNELLHPPVEQFPDIEFVLRGARDFVNPSELLHLPPRLA